MIVLVADSSVIFDLERGGLFEAAFDLTLTFVVPDLLYVRELEDSIGPHLCTLGLQVVELHPNEVQFAQDVRRLRHQLSLPDVFALSCARRPQHRLLAGDGALRAEAITHKVIVHGLLWVLDQAAEQRTVATWTLCEGLTRIAQHPRCRLPRDEVRKRLKLWCGM